MTTIKRKVQYQAGRRGRREGREGKTNTSAKIGRVPRVSRLMALAIRSDQLIRDGEISDQAELARLGHVTRARLTQIMNLLQLAPDIQGEILFLPLAERERDVVREQELRPIAALVDWRWQRRLWIRCCGKCWHTARPPLILASRIDRERLARQRMNAIQKQPVMWQQE